MLNLALCSPLKLTYAARILAYAAPPLICLKNFQSKYYNLTYAAPPPSFQRCLWYFLAYS